MRSDIVILGAFFADTTYRTDRLPRPGETVMGRSFALGPGGKASNQAVAAARARGAGSGAVHLVTRLGRDPFAAMAHAIWAEAGVVAHVHEDAEAATGAACILVEHGSGENAIVIAPGAAGRIDTAQVEAQAALFAGAAVMMTQLEHPLPAARRALEIARAGGARTILNPAPAAPLEDTLLALCDIVTPNETEAEALTGIAVTDLDAAARAGAALIARGAGAALITLGARGALWCDGRGAEHISALSAGKVVETTGAGDAFSGGFAAALAEGQPPLAAARFGCATAAIAVTRHGTAPSMPRRAEIEALLAAR
jgi:ribokinase